LELSDVEICLRLLGPEDLSPTAAASRYAASKQALIAAEELRALAGGMDAQEEGPKQSGMIVSLLRHAVSLLLRRLRLAVQNVHCRVEDPCSGRVFGFRLGHLRTYEPSTLNQDSSSFPVFPLDGEGADDSNSGAIQKHFDAAGIQIYWTPAGVNGDREKEQEWDILQSTNVKFALNTELAGKGSLDAGVRLSCVPLQLRSNQAADMLRCIDDLQRLVVRTRYAHLRPLLRHPSSQHGNSANSICWKEMWRYAVDAVLQDLKGPKNAARWHPPEAVQHARRRYILLYRKKMELEKEAQTQPQSRSRRGTGGEAPQSHNRNQGQGTHAAASSISGSATPRLSPIGEQQLLELENELSVSDIIVCRTTAKHAFEGMPMRPYSGGSNGGDHSDGSSETVSRRGVSWGVSKAVSVLGYVPRPFSSFSWIPQPSDSEVKELCEVMEFNPEQEEEKTASAAREFDSTTASRSAPGPAPVRGFSVVRCLVESVQVTLLSEEGQKQSTLVVDEVGVKVVQNFGGETLVTARLCSVLAQDWMSYGPEVATPLLSQQGHEYQTPKDPLIEETGEAAESGLPPPCVNLKFAIHSRTLDVMVQPLRVHVAPACMAAFAAFVTPLDHTSYSATCMRAVNALSLEARARIKAKKLRHLGTSLNLALKIVDVEVVLPIMQPLSSVQGLIPRDLDGHAMNDSELLLRTGEIVLHNIGLADASNEAVKIFSVLDTILDTAPVEATTARDELAAAAAIVEERLVYQSLEFSIRGVELLGPSTSPLGNSAQTTCFLQPVKLAGSLRLHRIPEDLALPQVLCSIQCDHIEASITPVLIEHIVQGISRANGEFMMENSLVQEAPAPSPSTTDLGPATAIIDVQFSGAHVSYTVESRGTKTPTDEAPCAVPVPEANLHVGFRRCSVALTPHAHGVATKVNLGGLLIRDLTFHDMENDCFSPCVRGVVPRLASRLAIEGVHVSRDAGPIDSMVQVQLVDVSANGYEGECGNFISR